MRIFSLILAAALLLAGSTMAGSVESDLPGVGTFSYNGTPIATASRPMIIATR